MARPRPYLYRSAPPLHGGGSLPTHDADGQPLIRLQTLGTSTILVGDARFGASAGTMFSLLLRIALTPGMILGRDVLLLALWPDQSETRQRANLRQALYKARSNGVRVSLHGDVVQLDASQVVRTFSIDRSAELFERDVTAGHEPFGTFLPGFMVPWAEYQEWIELQRELIHADVRRVLVEQLRGRRDRADWSGASALARWLLQFDPLNEEATLTLAECAFLGGSKTEALAIVDRYIADLGPSAGDLKLPASMLRKRIAEPTVRGRISFAPTERHFVGREEELTTLTSAMRRARWHDGGATLVHGTSGIGKSRLAHEVEKIATLEGARVVHTACREGDLHRSLSVFLDLIPALINQPGALGCAPEHLAALRRLAPEAGDAVNDHGDARELMRSVALLRRSILDLLGALCEEKWMLLVIDDVHWIDEHSWDILSDLIERTSMMRVFVLMTSREPHARPTRPERVPTSMRLLRLHGLTAEQCIRLSRAIGDDLSANVTDELGAWFVEASEGIPLFLRALVNHWIETGEAGGVPPTLQGVIEQRLGQLSPDALRVVQTAVLLGRWATVERVVKVLELRANEMLGCIEQIESLGVTAQRAGSVLAVHELVGRAAMARLSALTKRTVHGRAAEILHSEFLETQDLDTFLASLDHVQEIGLFDLVQRRTLENLSNIAEQALPEQGLRALQRLNGYDIAEQDRVAVTGATAKLLVLSGQYSTALSQPLHGQTLPELSPELTTERADLALSLVESEYRADLIVDREELLAYTARLVELTHLRRSTRIRAAEMGLVFASNDGGEAIARSLYGEVERTLKATPFDGDCDQIDLIFHSNFGDRARAAAIAREQLRNAQFALPSPALFHKTLRAGFALRLVAEGREHLGALEFAFKLSKTVSIPLHGMNCAFMLAQSYLELHEPASYNYWTERVLELHQQLSDPVASNFANSLYTRVALAEGRIADAKLHLREFLKHRPKLPTLRNKTYLIALEMAIGLDDDQWTPTADVVELLIDGHNRTGIVGTGDFIAAIAVEGLIRLGRKQEARKLLDRFLLDQRREVGPLGSRLAQAVAHLESAEMDYPDSADQ